jgi:uncharacterized circularly permuted ATP-grasp superfamily protein
MKHRKIAAIHLVAITVLITSFPVPGHSENEGSTYYDEVYDAKGKPRPQYRKVLKKYRKLTTEQKEEFTAKTYTDFKGDNALDPFPRLLTQSEYNTLRKGVEQRGTALRMFLQEYYGGGTSWQKVIPEATLERIMSRAGEEGFKGKIKPETISFPYGPDIVRTQSGAWSVIEDNPGYIGGIGDLKIAKETMARHMPQYKGAIRALHEPMEYYQEMVKRAKARAINGGPVVMLLTPPYPDNEDARMARIFKDLGVIPVTPKTGRKLVVEADGVYLKTSAKGGQPAKSERVGFVMMDTEHKFVDTANPLVRQSAKIFEAQGIAADEDPAQTAKIREALRPDPKTGHIDQRKLRLALNEWETDLPGMKKESIRGLTRALMDGRVASNYSPGVDFIGDKEFYTYVDDLVRHYLKEEPAVPNLPTSRMTRVSADGRTTINEDLMKNLFRDGNYKSHVFKIVDGRGGDGVWIGPKMKPEEAAEVEKKIRANPETFIVQKYSHLSVVQPKAGEEGRIVDLRLISDVGPEDVYVTRTPWGRGLPMGGNGKVNLSDRGREFTVAVVPDPINFRSCSGLFELLKRWSPIKR